MVATTRRFPELNGYRSIAVLLVVVFHVYQFSREGTHAARYLYEGTPLHPLLASLDTPVAWLFVLSGFLLFLPLAAAAGEGQAAPSSRVFLFHRALKVLPLYVLGILVVWSLRFTHQPGQWADLFEHLTFTHVWDSRYIFYTIGPAWAVGDGVVFCAMLAVMGPVLSRFTRTAEPDVRRLWLTAFPLSLVGLSVVYKLLMHFGLGLPASGMAWLFNPLAQADAFGMGMLLASLSALKFPPPGPRTVRRLVIGATGLLILTFALRASWAWVDVFAYSLSALAFTLLLAITVLLPRPTEPPPISAPPQAAAGSAFGRLLSWPFWVPLSTVSYGVYLWHEPLMRQLADAGWLVGPQPQAFWSNTLVVVAASVLLAALTYRLIEKPVSSARTLMTPEGHLRDDYALERLRYRLSFYPGRSRRAGKGRI